MSSEFRLSYRHRKREWPELAEIIRHGMPEIASEDPDYRTYPEVADEIEDTLAQSDLVADDEMLILWFKPAHMFTVLMASGVWSQLQTKKAWDDLTPGKEG